MPRRKPKHAIQPGQVLNPAGRPRGSVNEINQQIREAFAMLLHSQLPNLEHWIMRAAERNPEKAVDLMLRISERFVPQLTRTEITGGEGVPFTPITINLPNIPQFNVPTSIGEAAPTTLIASPAEEVKAIGEGTPTESQTSFPIPKFELSPNILRDIQETGPGDFNGSQTGSMPGSPTPE
jgi:hypothetical protein